MSNHYHVRDSSALKVYFGREVVFEARSAVMAKRLCKLLNVGLHLERVNAKQAKAFKGTEAEIEIDRPDDSDCI